MAKFLYIEDDDYLRDSVVSDVMPFFPEDIFVIAGSYMEAVAAIIEQGPFDAVVSDFNYSGVNDGGAENKNGSGGLDFLEYLKVKDIKVPFAFLAATDPREIQIRLAARRLELPPENIFQKPFSLFEVVEILKTRYCPEARAAAPAAEGNKTELDPK